MVWPHVLQLIIARDALERNCCLLYQIAEDLEPVGWLQAP